jgi:hypothetical protein
MRTRRFAKFVGFSGYLSSLPFLAILFEDRLGRLSSTIGVAGEGVSLLLALQDVFFITPWAWVLTRVTTAEPNYVLALWHGNENSRPSGSWTPPPCRLEIPCQELFISARALLEVCPAHRALSELGVRCPNLLYGPFFEVAIFGQHLLAVRAPAHPTGNTVDNSNCRPLGAITAAGICPLTVLHSSLLVLRYIQCFTQRAFHGKPQPYRSINRFRTTPSV